MNKRAQVYKEFAEFKKDRDDRNMDEICNVGGDFELQVQQKFLVEYMRKNPEWTRLLLYMNAGSGKTCCAISMAEEFLKTNPGARITVVVPARLRTNFFDELTSACGFDAYISKENFMLYHDPETPASLKKRIRKDFMSAIERNYEILSIEKFKSLIKDFNSLEQWADYLTHDRMVIVDEVHNLLSSTYKPAQLKTVLESHKLPKGAKGSSTLLFRYLTQYAHPSCKMVLMTATPIFDNIGQMKELVAALVPEKANKPVTKLSDAINLLRGRVSYFPGTAATAYPAVDYMIHEVPLTKTQDILSNEWIEKDEEDEDKEAFMSKQRQISIACLPANAPVAKDIPRVVGNMKEFAPKIVELMKELKKPGKHVVFSNFIKSGLRVIKAALEREGWVDYLSDAAKLPENAHKVFASWDGDVKDAQKQLIKSVVNSKANLDGRLIKVILGSPSIKEGVSFKHVQHLHMMDPVWNQSSKTQVEGRAIRFCSHVDIDEVRDAPLKRAVTIHIYKSVARARGLVQESCDMIIYDKVIPNKYKTVAVAEDALRRVAIDYHLFKRMYRSPAQLSASPMGSIGSAMSAIQLKEDLALKKKKVSKKLTNTCPKKRRPVEGVCPDNFEKRKNPQDFDCCYKMGRNMPTRRPRGNGDMGDVAAPVCPVGRSPPCGDGFYVKKNKKGVECCFKRRVAKAKLPKPTEPKKLAIKLKPKQQ